MMDNETNVKHDDRFLQVLLDDYKRISEAEVRQIEIIAQVLGIGIPILGAYLGFSLNSAANQNVNNNPLTQFHWALPLPIVIYCVYLIILLYSYEGKYWACRVLSTRINQMLPETALILYSRNYPHTKFFSTQNGSIKYRVLYFLAFISVVFLYIGITTFSFLEIYSESHFQGFLFITIYFLLPALLFYTLSGVLSDFPNMLFRFSKVITERHRIPNEDEALQIHTPGKSFISLFYWLFPRPWNLIGNGILGYWGGFVVALAVKAWVLDLARLDILNRLFSSGAIWTDIRQVSAGAVWGFGFLIFIVEEGMLQQAKYLWNDIRDYQYDKNSSASLPINRNRAVAAGAMSIPIAKRQMLLRGALAFVLGYLLGGPSMLLVFVVIIIHQILYMFFFKPRDNRYPLLSFFFMALNIPLRFWAGVVAVTGSNWTDPNLALYFVIFYFLSLGTLASMWNIDAEYKKMKSTLEKESRHGYFYDRGKPWSDRGLYSLLVVTLFVFYNPTLLTGLYDNIRRLFIQSNAVSGLLTVAFILVVIAATIIPVIILYRFLNPIVRLLQQITRKIRAILSPVVTIALIISAVSFFCEMYSERLALVMLVFTVNTILTYQDMTFKDYFSEQLKKLPLLLACWNTYLFHPEQGMTFRKLIKITFGSS
jgi:hypothetical protein